MGCAERIYGHGAIGRWGAPFGNARALDAIVKPNPWLTATYRAKFIGLAVTEDGRWEADGVYVELPPHLIGAAIGWADIG